MVHLKGVQAKNQYLELVKLVEFQVVIRRLLALFLRYLSTA